MPAKSGISHAFAAFTSIILGTFISNYLESHGPVITDITRTVGEVVIKSIGLSYSKTITGLLIISTILSFFWGVTYHIARH